MTSRTSLPNSLTSPILQRSSEGVSFRTPGSGQRVSPDLNVPRSPAMMNSSSSSSPYMIRDPVRDSLMRQQSAAMEAEEKSCSGVGGGSINMVIASVVIISFVYIAVFVILYLSSLNMVTDLVDGERVLNTRKVTLWTFIIGTALLLALYAGYRAFM